MDQRACVHCEELFDVNRRSAATHAFCQQPACQRERKRAAQQARRSGRPAAGLSPVGKQARARYMRAYRAACPDYRERERRRRAADRAGARPPPAGRGGAVTEAGLNHIPARVYLVAGFDGQVRLRVVAEAGKGLTVCPETSWVLTAPAVTEAG